MQFIVKQCSDVKKSISEHKTNTNVNLNAESFSLRVWLTALIVVYSIINFFARIMASDFAE